MAKKRIVMFLEPAEINLIEQQAVSRGVSISGYLASLVAREVKQEQRNKTLVELSPVLKASIRGAARQSKLELLEWQARCALELTALRTLLMQSVAQHQGQDRAREMFMEAVKVAERQLEHGPLTGYESFQEVILAVEAQRSRNAQTNSGEVVGQT